MKDKSNLVEYARVLSEIAHQGQFRKNGVTPYHVHPARVAARLKDSDLKVVAYLHDVLEDTSTTEKDLLEKGIPSELVELVKLLTRPKDLPYQEYLKQVSSDPRAIEVKIADIQDNISDNPSQRQLVNYALAILVLLGKIQWVKLP